jgi:subtilase family serine protease
LLALLIAPPAWSQAPGGQAQPLVTQPVDSNSLMPLPGNTHGAAKIPANDRGLVDDSMPLPEMRVQLRRPAAQEQAFEQLIEQLHDPNSPHYHHWLTAAEIGAQFGPAQSDIAAVGAWLRQSGFTVGAVSPSGMLIDFSGTAGQVRRVFRTEIHNVGVRGEISYANVSDPQIPAALGPALVGIQGLNNIRPMAHMKRLPPRPANGPQPGETQAGCSGTYVTGTTCYAVTPADLATIYNFNPVLTVATPARVRPST